jgi:TldD protein
MPADRAPLLGADVTAGLVARALRRGGDFADLYVERRDSFTLSLDDRRVERAQTGSETGAAIRVVVGDATYFGHVDGLAEADLERLADEVASAVRAERAEPRPLAAAQAPSLQQVRVDPQTVPPERKADLLRECDERARSIGSEVSQVAASYVEGRRRVQVANSDGLLGEDDRTRVRLGAQVVARRDDRVETGTESLAGHVGFELFDGDPAAVAEQAARRAVTMLGGRPAPAGRMPVVVGNGFGGVLFHEATGHGLESDAVQKHASVYEGRLRDKLASPIVSAYDDGTMTGEWGTDGIDDEGTPCQSTRVLDEGELCTYLYDLLRARKDGRHSTGNGRRQSFRHLPIPRMTNTYIAPLDTDPQDIIAGVQRGLYAVSFGGGQVEPATGDFVFGLSEGYLIENGEVTSPVRGATLIGNGIDVLTKIDAIGNDFAMKSGFCGKDGQQVPVGTGQPTVRIAELTVGGTDV